MNLARPLFAVASHFFRLKLILRKILPRRKCRSFTVQNANELPGIEKVYVINLNREPGRWTRMKQELKQILDCSGTELLERTERYVAIDANDFTQDPEADADVDPYYTLEDQLFVEPQPFVLPTHFDLTSPIRMSRAEIAVARSHINVWRKVANSADEYVLILEDDVWFHSGFAGHLDQAWSEIMHDNDKKDRLDVLYLSYLEVKHGAPKTFISSNLFRPFRGLWYLSGYVISRNAAKILLELLPCRGPIDLWINHQFKRLKVYATKNSYISQRRDSKSTNSYSILPSLASIGAITSEGASLFNIRPTEQPVFAFGPELSGLSSLAMALSMLGYRCCSDLQALPTPELELLLKGKNDRIFNAYVNIGSLKTIIEKLHRCYPKAKFIFTKTTTDNDPYLGFGNALDIAVLNLEEPNKWQVVCQHLRCPPPNCAYPAIEELGQRPITETTRETYQTLKPKEPKHDKSPWIVEPRKCWQGIRISPKNNVQSEKIALIKSIDYLEYLDTKRWLLRSDTFTDNLALFRPSNIEFSKEKGAILSVKKEPLGVRNYTAASLCSRDQFLFGRFEATIQASDAPGVVTGFFLHRNSPRQEIDIEIVGNRPNRLLANVFYNPGNSGSNFDYGYRGTPSIIELGFNASKSSHRFAIEWSPTEIRWLVDDKLIHSRTNWNPTPIPLLPMTLHINSWLSRSTQLAGRINNRRLPATTTVRSISVESNSAASVPGADNLNQSNWTDS